MKGKRILWVLGEQLAGKSMLASIMRSYGASVLQIGEELRRTITPREFAGMSNPYGPEEVEQRVQEMISQSVHIFKRDTKSVLVIDSAPRNNSQALILSSVQEMSTVLFLFEDYEIRKNRARQRYGNDLTLFEKREAFERAWLKEFVTTCDEMNLDHIIMEGARHG